MVVSDFTVPENTKIIIGEITSTDASEELAREKISPVLAMYKAKNFDDAISIAQHLIKNEGYGHTCSVYVNKDTRKELLDKLSLGMKTCRILVNTPSSHGSIGGLYNSILSPSLTLGCGTWGGNSISDNLKIWSCTGA